MHSATCFTLAAAASFVAGGFAVLAAGDSERGGKTQFVFHDAGDEAGVFPHVAGMRGHGVAWGDVDGNGWPDLFVATFHNAGSRASVLLRNDRGKFRVDEQQHVQTSGSGSGALLADFTNSGRLDLYVSNCFHRGKTEPSVEAPAVFLRNDGGGKFTDVSQQSGTRVVGYAGRGAAALDFDGDGLLDFLTCERYYGDVQYGPALFHNRGKLRFENAAQAAGLPARFSGLGVATADVNGDGWPDMFLTGGSGDHRLFLNDGRGKFAEAPGTREVFHWDCPREDDTPAGVCIADVNRDGLPDVVIGHHYKHPWSAPEPVRLYMHRGVRDGVPKFEDVTSEAGLAPLTLKGPHVEIQDFDNDGWPDIYVSIVKFAGGRPYPLIYKNLGAGGKTPRFREDMWAVNDFPTAEDRGMRGGTGNFFAKLYADHKIMYSAAAPSCDYDRDGRLDLFLTEWSIHERSLLLHNDTPGGNWLDVIVEGSGGVNRMGIGSKVLIFPAGKSDRAALLSEREIAAGYGYCSGQEAVAHFGLGDVDKVDVHVTLPHGKGTLMRTGVAANQRLTLTVADANVSPKESRENEPPTKSKKKTATKKNGDKSTKPPATVALKKEKRAKPATPVEIPFPPTLPGGKQFVTDTSEAFLKPTETLRKGVAIAKAPPTVDFMYYPGQDYPGKPWSNWGDSLAVGGKYYASIGDHLAIGAKGDGSHGGGAGLVFEYDPQTKSLRELVNTTKALNLPAGHYTPGKIHSRLDLGSDGCLYFATHRGSDRSTTDRYHYQGDWIFRCDPRTGKTDAVVQGAVPKHSIPTSVLDPDRLIFYGGTAPGSDSSDQSIQFFAYDLKGRKLLYSGPDGPSRYMIFARSTGKVYYTEGKDGKTGASSLLRFDPSRPGTPVEIKGEIGIRAATEETPAGMVYTVSQARRGEEEATIYAFDVKTEKIETLGAAAVGLQSYIASLDADASGRYLYYIPGAHGGSEVDGSAVVQFDTKTRRKKVIAFLHPFYQERYGAILVGTFSSAVDPQGDKLYITWNVNRGGKGWDSCALTVIHIPESERTP